MKHKHNTPNPIIKSEEESILAAVDKALSSSRNSQTVGTNGEIPLRHFFNRYLPYTLRAASGHFITPNGNVSPQLDVMILDSRYPLLAENNDGSVLAMLHSVVEVIEVKTRITTADVQRLWHNRALLSTLSAEVEGYGGETWGCLSMTALAYRSQNRLETLANRYFEYGTPEKGSVDLYLLRLPEKDQTATENLGAWFHFEPPFEEEGDPPDKYYPTLLRQFTPLSDLYYHLVQDSYYCLDARGFSLADIGQHFMQYMSFSSYRPDEEIG